MKPCPNQNIFILCKAFKNVNIKKKLTFSIWGFKQKVMAKKELEIILKI
jgi:hypothetical protein